MIRIKGDTFVDEHGRLAMLRGVNLGGSSKVPSTPNGATWNSDGFFEHRTVSFVDRPFPLAEAEEHFSRLKHWGYTCVRLLTTWEAIEHAGPGRYDEQYLEYFCEIVKCAEKHGISVIVDPHQDVWSRFSGGDGAPGWTLEAAGLDMQRLAETGAALCHQTYDGPLPPMIWPTNYGKLANLTMWTLFFAGNDFAPGTCVSGVPIQIYLQGHYVRAIEELAIRLKDMPNVIGFGALNEPSCGLIGMEELARKSASPVLLGETPTPLQAFALGDGIPQKVDVYKLRTVGFARSGVATLNLSASRAWQDGVECIWRSHGVWDTDAAGRPQIRKPDYFTHVGDRKVNFTRDYYLPFAERYAEAILRHLAHVAILVEGPPDKALSLESTAVPNAVYAPHWYDALTLLRKNYSPRLGVDALKGRVVIGRAAVRRSYAEQIGTLVKHATAMDVPAIIAETGIPFDMGGKRAYRSGRFTQQIQALDATMCGIEANCASVMLWNYTSDNSNEHGDQWNDEDFSIFSVDQKLGTGTLDDGGRALEAAVRPYPMAVPGTLLSLSFDINTRTFSCSFCLAAEILAPAEFYIPDVHYADGCVIEAPHGETTLENQRLVYTPCRETEEHTIVVRPK